MPQNHRRRRPGLLLRNRIHGAIREYLAEQDFIEADCGALQVSPGNEAHLHAFATTLIDDSGTSHRRYLHTSPEFACKKLLAAGETRLFFMGHVFRNRERTPSHLPEFTMLEWYRAGAGLQSIIEDTVSLVRLAASTAGMREFAWRGRTADPFAPPEMLTVAEAFARHAGVPLLDTIASDGTPDRDALAALSPIPVKDGDSWSDIFSLLLVNLVEPHLGSGDLTILYGYPASEAALARISPDDRRIAERFEAYACGVELANGFDELTDPQEQRRRFTADMDLKQARYGERYPLDEQFLAALAHMPPAAGAALGLDRLVMLAAGARSIDEIVWTPPE
jgi:lysyl-tRNA synthetase class 2